MSSNLSGRTDPARLDRFFIILARIFCSAALSVGVLVTLGWMFKIEILVCGWPGYVPMKLNAAVCFVISAAALWLTTLAPSPSTHRVVRTAGAVVFVLGMLTLLEHMTGIDLHIDELLLKDAFSKLTPGRMAVPTAVNFALAGGFLLCVSSQRKVFARTCEMVALGSNLGAQWAVLDVILRSNKEVGIALHAAVALLLLSWSMLLIPSQFGALRFLRSAMHVGTIMRRLLPTATLAPLLLALGRWSLSDRLSVSSGTALLVAVYSATLLSVAIWTANSMDSIETQQRDTENELSMFFKLPLTVLLSIRSANGRFKRVSSSWHGVLGYSEEELVGHHFTNFVCPLDREHSETALSQLKEGQAVMGFENRYRTKSGTERWISWHSMRMANGDVYSVGEDITDRHNAMLQLRELNENLETAVEERTAELQVSNKELEAFAYSVSHDLRAPLRHIDGFLALLRKRVYDSIDPTARHYLDVTLSASRRLGVLIDELLQFSRLGRTTLRAHAVQPTRVVHQLMEEAAPELEGRDIRWNIGPLPSVLADEVMLRQLFQNLIGNALKFTRKCAQAKIAISATEQPDGTALFCITDNGVGFSMEYYGKLFQVFQRLHAEEDFEGTGIGLANARKIVQRHGGEIWAEGEVGRGASFFFSLPLAATEIQTGGADERLEAHIAG